MASLSAAFTWFPLLFRKTVLRNVFWNSRTASEYRMPFLYICQTSRSNSSFTAAENRAIRLARWIGHQDNNVAEYMALLEALQCALALKARGLHVYSDSQVVVRQMKGTYHCRSSRLHSLNWTCRKLAQSLIFSISHIPREANADANLLARSAVLDGLRATD